MKQISTIKTLVFSSILLLAKPLEAQKDTIPPQITVCANDTICIQIGSVWVDQVSVSDNQSDVSSITLSKNWGFNGVVNTMIRRGYPVTYEATDSNGNKTIVNVTYRVDDCIAPEIALNTEDTVCHEVNTPYNPIQATATDNYYPNNQVSLTLRSNVDANLPGLYLDVYEAIDASGNKTIKVRVVKVGECMVASLNELNTVNLSLYPNPVSELLNVKLFETEASFVIQTIDGRAVLDGSLNHGLNLVSVQKLLPGVYTIRFNSGKMTSVKKIIVQ